MSPPLTINKPTLLLDKNKAIKNITTMFNKAQQSSVCLRPHFKTHQSAQVGAWFKKLGVKAITVSAVDMALYFAKHGWQDITLAFPVNWHQCNALNHLASKIKLNLLLESVETVKYLTQHLKNKVNIYLKIDVGYGRTGLAWDDFEGIKTVALAVQQVPHFNLYGLLTHAGHTYQATTPAQVEAIYQTSLKRLQAIQKRLQAINIVTTLSIGDTPGCSIVNKFVGVDEIRPGNFVFFDLMQYKIGSCKAEDIAVAVACPVVAKHTDRNQFVLYGGAVHFSKEFIIDKDGSPTYGYILHFKEGLVNNGLASTMVKETGWSLIDNKAKLISLSQEHGVVQVDKNLFSQVQVGDVVGVLPVHSCLTANLLKQYLTLNGDWLTMIPSF